MVPAWCVATTGPDSLHVDVAVPSSGIKRALAPRVGRRPCHWTHARPKDEGTDDAWTLGRLWLTIAPNDGGSRLRSSNGTAAIHVELSLAIRRCWLQEHQGIGPGFPTVGQRGKASASRNRKSTSEGRSLLNHRPVVPCVGDEQDDSTNAKVTLFAADSALQRLNVVDPGFSFDHHLHARPVYDAVRTSWITGDGDGDLGSPPEARRQPCAESVQ